MRQQRPEPIALTGFSGVHVLRSGKLGCAAIRLNGGGLCIYSPLPDLDEAEFVGLEGLGAVSFLLAPNHYHHRGIAQHVERFPNASLVCAIGAKPRLQKLTGFAFEGLDTLSKELLPNVQLLEPEGLKTGEVWVEVAANEGLAWIVCDCFSTEGRAVAPTMLSTFPKFGILDRKAYRSWVTAQIDRRPPTALVPCHGLPVARPDLGTSLVMLLREHVWPNAPAKTSPRV